MDIEQYEKAGLMAQTISFAFKKIPTMTKLSRRCFMHFLINTFCLWPPEVRCAHIDAIVELWRKKPSEFDEMIKELQDEKLIETF